MEFRKKEFDASNGKTVILSMWGIAGKESFWGVVSPYCSGAHGIILYYDPSRKESFEHIKTVIEENIEIFSNLKAHIHLVGVSRKKGDNVEVPDKDVKALGKKIGAEISKCCLEDMTSINKVLNGIISDAIKKYKIKVYSNKLSGEPSKDPKENSLTPLISLLKCAGEGVKKEVKRNENGLFGDYSEADNTLTYRMSVLGHMLIGKSCFRARCLKSVNSSYNPRIINLPNNARLKIEMTEGKLPKSESDDAADYTKAHAILLCYDITHRYSFDALKEVVKMIREHAMAGAVLMVVGLRCDDKDRVDVTGSEGQSFADENGMVFCECSAMENVGVSCALSKVLFELQRIDGFALPIRADYGSYALPPLVDDEKADKGVKDSSSLLDKILCEHCNLVKKKPLEKNCFKILILGDEGSGKTSLINRCLKNTFSDEYVPTEEHNIYGKSYHFLNGISVKLFIHDVPVNSNYRCSHAPPYKGTQEYIVCYDTTKPDSYSFVRGFMSETERCGPENTPYVLAGTKSDLPPDADSVKEVQNFAEENKLPVIKCSAKTGAGVNEVFERVVLDIGHNVFNVDFSIYFDKSIE